MGQQQLLLVILVTIIVGIATVVAINTFSSASDQANNDAIRQDIASIAASAQGYFMKPEMLGGGGNDFDGIDFTKIAFGGEIDATTKTKSTNANAEYVLNPSGTSLTVTGTSASSGVIFEATVTRDNIEWVKEGEPATP